MIKIKDKVIFPLLMDMGGFAAYGGGMSADVALQQQQQQQQQQQLGREGGRGGRRRVGTTTVVLGQAEGKGEGEEGEEGREEGLRNGNGTHYHDDDNKLPTMNGGANRPSSSTPSSLPPSSLRYKYLLQAVIVHHGSADSGHYTVFRRLSPPPSPSTLLSLPIAHGHMEGGREGREGRGVWVHISDEAVAPATVEEVLESEAYMLFYQSLDSLKEEKEEKEERREERREEGEEKEEEEEEEDMVA
jgi:hypothetical protein